MYLVCSKDVKQITTNPHNSSYNFGWLLIVSTIFMWPHTTKSNLLKGLLLILDAITTYTNYNSVCGSNSSSPSTDNNTDPLHQPGNTPHQHKHSCCNLTETKTFSKVINSKENERQQQQEQHNSTDVKHTREPPQLEIESKIKQSQILNQRKHISN